jgi:hypothetical protein
MSVLNVYILEGEGINIFWKKPGTLLCLNSKEA